VRALVTGGHGFVGRHLRDHLEAMGDEVTSLDRRGPDAVDVTDRDRLVERVRAARADVLYHLAAFSHVGESFAAEADVLTVNVDGTANVLTACRAAGIGRVIVVGSAEQYGVVQAAAIPLTEDAPTHPVSPYARSKQAAETLALDEFATTGLGVVCVRAFNHTGPGQPPRFLVPALAARIVAAERAGMDTVTVGNVDPVRDYSDVRDVARAYRLLAERGEPGTVYNVCSGHGVSVADLARGLLALAARPLELVVDPGLVRATDVPVLVGDPSRRRDATGWTPEIPLAQTLADVLEHARA
jgi:GDP-4-dehydro-6-deoxy-D-mannose reductase